MKKSHFLQRIFVFMMAFLMGTLPVASTYAKLDDKTLDRFAQNNILFYDPTGYGTCMSGAYLDGPIAISGGTSTEKVWSGLTSFLTPEQAAGVMGNMESESHFNPAQHEVGQMNKHQPGFKLDENADVSYGLGLIQWSFGRRVGVYNYIKEADASLVEYLDDYKSYSPDYWNGEKFIAAASVEVFDKLVSLELQYLKDELNNNASYSGLLDTTTVYDAAKFFLEHVEKPQNPTIENHPIRVTQAEAFYTKYAGSVTTGNGSSSPCSTNLQSLADYVKAYVWPNYRGGNGNYTERMPEYANAVSRRKGAGKYVGGSVDGVPGIDCGGFVTTIMQESGYEPEYNQCGSNTAPQEWWLREGGGSDRWVWLNPGGTPMDAADLQLGDVAFTGAYNGNGCVAGGEHTYMFIGDGFGFETNIASASYSRSSSGGRAPMSGREGIRGARWYRKVR